MSAMEERERRKAAGPGHSAAGPGHSATGTGHSATGPGHSAAGAGHVAAGADAVTAGADPVAAGADAVAAGADPLTAFPDEPGLRELKGDPLPVALSLVRRLVRSNLDSLNLAKDLMLAQEVADVHTARMDHAIERAATSAGDQTAIDKAVAAVSAAEHAHVAELTLAKAWGIHLGEVHRLVEVAGALVDGLSPAINIRSAHEPADSLR